MNRFRLSPYSPGDPVTRPGDLIGRSEDFRNLLGLVSAGRNVLVTGERGVGKTSLLTAASGSLRNKDAGLDRRGEFGNPIRTLIGFATCSDDTTIDSLADSLLRSLTRSSGLDLCATSKSSWTMKATVKVLEAGNEEERSATISRWAAARVVDAIGRVRRDGTHRTSVIAFFIDEADRPDRGVRLGTFTRNIKEAISAEGLGPVAFVLAGQKQLMPRLQAEHPSVSRSYEVIWVPVLSSTDCEEIIRNGERATGTAFDDGIRLAIAKASKGFPAVVHRLADSCFRADSDGFVDLFDFEDGLAAAIDGFNRENRMDAISRLAGPLGMEVVTLLATEFERCSPTNMASVLNRDHQELCSVLDCLCSAGVLEEIEKNYAIRDHLVAAYVALETTRQRDIRAIRILADRFEESGWSVRGLGPNEGRIFDIVMSKGRWIFRRTAGVAYVGDSGRLSVSGAERLKTQLFGARELHGVGEILVVGTEVIDKFTLDVLTRERRVTYLSWDMLEGGNPRY